MDHHQSDCQLTNRGSHRLSHHLFREPGSTAAGRAHRSNSRLVNVADEFFLAKLLCRKGDAERTMAPWFIWLPKGRNTSACRAVASKQNCDSPRYPADSRYIRNIIAGPGLLSVTESIALPPQPQGRSYAKTLRIHFVSGWYLQY